MFWYPPPKRSRDAEMAKVGVRMFGPGGGF